MESVVVRVGTKGRIVIPKKIREELSIKDKVRLVLDEKGKKLIILPSPSRQLKLPEL